ncbi:hypothetical protein KI387_041162, partial [Taxus chinensis]
EEFVFTNKVSTFSLLQYDYNTRSKRWMTEVAVPIPPAANGARKESLTSTAPPPTTKQETSEAIQNQGNSHPIAMRVKYHQISKAQPLGPINVFEQLKRVPTNVSLWVILGIPERKELLQEALKSSGSLTTTRKGKEKLKTTQAQIDSMIMN